MLDLALRSQDESSSQTSGSEFSSKALSCGLKLKSMEYVLLLLFSMVFAVISSLEAQGSHPKACCVPT